MSDITTTQIVFGIIAAIALGIWTAFVYWHRHMKEVEKTCRELWPELQPFHEATQKVLLMGIHVVGTMKADPDCVEELQARHVFWRRLLDEKHGRCGPRGKRRANKISVLFHRLENWLLDPDMPEPHGITRSDAMVQLCKAQLKIGRDPDYFSR